MAEFVQQGAAARIGAGHGRGPERPAHPHGVGPRRVHIGEIRLVAIAVDLDRLVLEGVLDGREIAGDLGAARGVGRAEPGRVALAILLARGEIRVAVRRHRPARVHRRHQLLLLGVRAVGVAQAGPARLRRHGGRLGAARQAAVDPDADRLRDQLTDHRLDAGARRRHGRAVVADRVAAGHAHLVQPRQLDRLAERSAGIQAHVVRRTGRRALDAPAEIAHRLAVAPHLEQGRFDPIERRAPAQQVLGGARRIGERDAHHHVVAALDCGLHGRDGDVDGGRGAAGQRQHQGRGGGRRQERVGGHGGLLK